MGKISAIIPTLLINKNILNKLIYVLDNDETVDEIILINNSQECFKPDNKAEKLKIFNQKTNLFVNPSWNLGIELMENDIFLIINDDVLCPKNFCSMVLNSEILDKDNTGLVGLYPIGIHNHDRLSETDFDIPEDINPVNFRFEPFEEYTNTGNWGSAFFGRKENYYKIPDEFKIIFGDNYLLKQNLNNNKINYTIHGCNIEHLTSLSSAESGFSQEVSSDIIYAEKIGLQSNTI